MKHNTDDIKKLTCADCIHYNQADHRCKAPTPNWMFDTEEFNCNANFVHPRDGYDYAEGCDCYSEKVETKTEEIKNILISRVKNVSVEPEDATYRERVIGSILFAWQFGLVDEAWALEQLEAIGYFGTRKGTI
jgi:hypothetical protein